MSLIQNMPAQNRCIQLKSSGKIKHTALTNLLNNGNGGIGLVEINLFGINQVYSLLDFDKIRNFDYSFNMSRSLNQHGELSLSKAYTDDPLINDVNMKCKSIDISRLTIADWINFYQINSIISGLDIISEMTVNDSVEYTFSLRNNLYDINDIDFRTSIMYKYIVIYNDRYEFSNNIPKESFDGILINIPETKCWQYLDRVDFYDLVSILGIEIRYAVTDSPRCFSSIGYYQEYCADNINDLVKLGIYIPMDIYFSKVFEVDEPIRKNRDGYDALDIYVKHHNYNCSVILTYRELGIDYSADNETGYDDNFQLLKLIINIISLKPY